MLQKLGNKNFALLSKLMHLHTYRHNVIAQNVANINTPNYHRRTFNFESALNRAIEKGSQSDYESIRGWVDRPNTTAVRNNGNNVDIDMEMVALNKNATSFEIYAQLYRQKSQMVKDAIKGGR